MIRVSTPKDEANAKLTASDRYDGWRQQCLRLLYLDGFRPPGSSHWCGGGHKHHLTRRHHLRILPRDACRRSHWRHIQRQIRQNQVHLLGRSHWCLRSLSTVLGTEPFLDDLRSTHQWYWYWNPEVSLPLNLYLLGLSTWSLVGNYVSAAIRHLIHPPELCVLIAHQLCCPCVRHRDC